MQKLNGLMQKLSSKIDMVFDTARKRSLGQGNIFAPVCQSVHGGSTWAGTPPPRAGTPTPQAGTPLWAGTPPLGRYNPPSDGQCAGGTHPTGMHSCLVMLRQKILTGSKKYIYHRQLL